LLKPTDAASARIGSHSKRMGTKKLHERSQAIIEIPLIKRRSKRFHGLEAPDGALQKQVGGKREKENLLVLFSGHL